jgi:hypothetical protein
MNGEAAAQQPSKSVAATSHEEVQDCLRKIWRQPALWNYDTDAPKDLSICKALPEDIDRVRKSHEEVQDCLRDLWEKPVFWDQATVAPVNPSVCKAPPDKVDEALKQQHLIAFRVSNAVLLTSERSFDKNYRSNYYKWETPELNIRFLDRLIPGGRQPTEAELHEVADVVLKRSHLVPLSCPFKASEGQVGRLALNIYVWIHKMHPGSEQESAIVLLADSDADHEMVVGTGRIVHGELQDGHFQYRWESPLVYTSMFQSGFVDLLRNGNLQIILTSPNFGKHYTVFYAFDLDGREISRDPSTCGAFSNLTTHSTIACPIQTDSDIEIVDTANGPKELHTIDGSENGIDPTVAVKDIRYAFRNGHYEVVMSKSVKGTAARPPNASALNEEGMRLMKEGDYDEAAEKFNDAIRADEGNVLYQNNAGFAYYKAGKYGTALFYLEFATRMSPDRAVAYLNLGDDLVELNREPEGPKAYAKYLELQPKGVSAPDIVTEARKAYQKYLELALNSKVAPDVKKKLDALPPTP